MRKLVLVGRKAPDEHLFSEIADTKSIHPPGDFIDWNIVQKFTVVQSSETAEPGVE